MHKSLTLIGFGNQAKTWALNLRDSGYKVYVGLRPSSRSKDLAVELGLEVFELNENSTPPTRDIAILTPDSTHRNVLKKLNNKEECNFIFAHGHSLYFEKLSKEYPNLNMLLLAPKAIASEMRFQYETKGAIGGVYSLECAKNKESSLNLISEIAKDLGIKSFHETTIEMETKADLFSEQTILCSILPYSALHSFNKLIEKGINEETAYFECWHEIKLIAEAMVKMGPAKFFELISPNALVGSEIGRQTFFDKSFTNKLEKLYNDINDWKFQDKLENTDVTELKSSITQMWKNERLTKVHDRLSKELY
ncbi:MAG: hypothetical protein CME64_09765 [Halobacteriovoraceae bacterium]|nr:hypothetical protein [Halobacteriovoraceae bacterium]|tara:strand:- start:44116 stop:45039 length:924 start_codon:yes stop_codon:yes gene_type:complete